MWLILRGRDAGAARSALGVGPPGLRRTLALESRLSTGCRTSPRSAPRARSSPANVTQGAPSPPCCQGRRRLGRSGARARVPSHPCRATSPARRFRHRGRPTMSAATGRRRSSTSTSRARSARRPGRGSGSCRCASACATSRSPPSARDRRPCTRPPRPPRPRNRAPSGRWSTRSTPITDTRTTPICGSGRGRSGSTWSASSATAARHEVAARVRADFESGIRAGVTATPTAFAGGERLDGDVARQLAALAAR